MDDFERELKQMLTDRATAVRFEGAQASRVVRRARIHAISLLAAAAVVAVAVFAAQTVWIADRAAPPSGPIGVTATIDVGERPVAVAVGEGSVWVANEGDGTVARIDPETNEVVARIPVADVLGGPPSELLIAQGYVWVASRRNMVVGRIDPRTNEVLNDLIDVGSTDHLEMAYTGSPDPTLWLTSTSFAPLRVGGLNVSPFPTGLSAEPPRAAEREEQLGDLRVQVTDIASDGRFTWGLDPFKGWTVVLTYEFVAVERDVIHVAWGNELKSSPSGDVAVGFGYAWALLGGTGRLARLNDARAMDSSSEHFRAIDVGGRGGALAVGADHLWALVFEDGRGRLLRIDPESVQVIADGPTLRAEPVDLAYGYGAVWVVQREAGTVSRIDVEPAPKVDRQQLKERIRALEIKLHRLRERAKVRRLFLERLDEAMAPATGDDELPPRMKRLFRKAMGKGGPDGQFAETRGLLEREVAAELAAYTARMAEIRKQIAVLRDRLKAS